MASPIPGVRRPLADAAEVVAFASNLTVDQRLSAVVSGFDAPFYQAGLAGYSDAAMRIIARRQGCPYCMTEALLDRMLLTPGKARGQADPAVLRANVPESREDHPLGGQIIGAQASDVRIGEDDWMFISGNWDLIRTA